jgi:mycothiol synthase
MADLRWEPPDPSANAAWLDLLAACEAVDHWGEVLTELDLSDEWKSVWTHPERDARFVWDDDELVGFAWPKVMPGGREHHKVDFWGSVRPSHRRRGLGGALFDWQIERGVAAIAALDPAIPSKLTVTAHPEHTDALALARARGFEIERTFLEVVRPTALPLEPASAPAGVTIILFDIAHDEAARLAHTEAFADHWGSEPRSEEEWRQWYTGHRGFRPELSRLALDDGTGAVISLVLCAAYPADWQTEPVEAWVNTVGTVRAWRGQGLGQAILTASLEAIAAADTGFERSILGVDAENPTGALRLYRRLGFEDERTALTLGRPV